MTTLLAFLFMLVVVAGMAVGVMFGRRPISGSCGGMKAMGLGLDCEICGGDPARCDAPATGPGSRGQTPGVRHHVPKS